MAVLKLCFFSLLLWICVQSIPVPEIIETRNDEPDLRVYPVHEFDKNVAVFNVSPKLCEEAVEKVDQNCINHCSNLGYQMGLCHGIHCSCI